MGKTTIEWTQNADGTPGETWNPIRGCSRISPGCGGGLRGPNGEQGGCYAEGIAGRFSGEGQPFHGFATMENGRARWTGKVELFPELLSEPLRRRKPTTFFMSMTDLFHEALTFDAIAAVFGIMAAANRHTFQILTKRAERMAEFFAWVEKRAEQGLALFSEDSREWRIWQMLYHYTRKAGGAAPPHHGGPWPLPNVWIGVSVELEKYKPRLAHLRACPAAVRFASFEPLLGDLGSLDLMGIDQVIAGAESGRGARPMEENWVRSIRDQAKAQGVAMFYKQKLERGRKVSLPLLDGREWAEMPVREVASHG